MSPLNRLATFYVSSFKDLPLLSWILLLTIFINAIWQMFVFFSTLYLNTIGFDIEFIGIIIACYNVGGLAGTYIGGALSEKFGVIILPTSLLVSSLLLLGMIAFNDGVLIGDD